MVLAAEVGGRWSGETAKFLAALANAKAQASPFKTAYLRKCSTRMVGGPSVHSILDQRRVAGWSGDAPSLHEVVRDDRFG